MRRTAACPRKCKACDCGGAVQRAPDSLAECGAPLRHRAAVRRFRANADQGRCALRAARNPCLSSAASMHAWHQRLWYGGRTTFSVRSTSPRFGIHRLGELVASFADDDRGERRIPGRAGYGPEAVLSVCDGAQEGQDVGGKAANELDLGSLPGLGGSSAKPLRTCGRPNPRHGRSDGGTRYHRQQFARRASCAVARQATADRTARISKCERARTAATRTRLLTAVPACQARCMRTSRWRSSKSCPRARDGSTRA